MPQRFAICIQLLFAFALTITFSAQGFAIDRAPKPKRPSITNDSATIKVNGAMARRSTFPNGLTVILMSSPTSKKATAGLAVKVGASADPDGKEGLAHYLEHMLIMGGSKEFPEPGAFIAFIEGLGGQSNAFTGLDLTTYLFDTPPASFELGLQNFSRFFVSPLFDPSLAEREKNAVHNEYLGGLENRKMMRAHFVFLKDTQPIFSVGNLETLKNVSVGDTRKFYEKHYVANGMTLFLSGPQSLDELGALARTYFSDIRSSNSWRDQRKSVGHVLDLDKLPATVLLKATKPGEKTLHITFPSSNSERKNLLLLNTLSTIIGDETSTSLMVQLQKQGWVPDKGQQLSSGVSDSSVSVTVQVTDLGFENRDAVVQMVSDYLRLVKDNPPPKELQLEVKRTIEGSKLLDSYYELDMWSAFGLLKKLAAIDLAFLKWPEHILGKTLSLPEGNAHAALWENMEFQKPLVFAVHPDIPETPKPTNPFDRRDIGGAYLEAPKNGQDARIVDTMFNFTLKVEPLAIAPAGNTPPTFQFPEANPFVPSTFQSPTKEAFSFTENAGDFGSLRKTHLLANTLPMTYFSAELYSDALDVSKSKDRFFLSVLSNAVNSAYEQSLYPMQSAGYTFVVNPNSVSAVMHIHFFGWTENFDSVWKTLLETVPLNTDETGFEKAKTDVVLASSRRGLDSMIDRAYLPLLKSKGSLSHSEVEALSANYTFSDFQSQLKDFRNSITMTGNITGSFEASAASSVVSLLESQWDLTWNPDIVGPAPERKPFLDGTEEMSVTTLGDSPELGAFAAYWNFDPLVEHENERLYGRLLGSWFSNSYFKEFRTIQQKAYAVGAFGFDRGAQSGLVYFIQTPHDLDTLKQDSNQFFVNWVQNLKTHVSQETFETSVEGLEVNHGKPAQNEDLHLWLYQKHLDGFTSIEEMDQQLSDVLETISLESVHAWALKRLEVGENPDGTSFVEKITKE